MKSIGIVRRVDDLGRIVIPKETRKILSIDEKDPLEIYTDGDQIILRKYNPGCKECGELKGVKEIPGLTDVKLCPSCLKKLASAIEKEVNENGK